MSRRWARRAHRGWLDELATSITWAQDPALAARHSPTVSAWTVHQHLEHLWRADSAMLEWLVAVAEGSAEDDGPGTTFTGAMIMWLGRIPRGRGRAPQFTVPDHLDLTEISAGLETVRGRVESIGPALPALASSTLTRRHPLLGCFTAAEWLRFAHVHHVHHRKIVEEIRDAVG